MTEKEPKNISQSPDNLGLRKGTFLPKTANFCK